MDGSTRRKEETVEKATTKETATLTVMNGQLPEKNGWIPKRMSLLFSLYPSTFPRHILMYRYMRI